MRVPRVLTRNLISAIYKIYINTYLLGEELEYVGGLGGSRFGFGGSARKASLDSNQTQTLDSETDENEEMEMT